MSIEIGLEMTEKNKRKIPLRIDGPIFIKNSKNLRVENATSQLDEEFPEK